MNIVKVSEPGFLEWDGNGMQPVNTQKDRQAICTARRHLPSVCEWTELEQEIYEILPDMRM